MKKFLSIMLMLAVVFSFAACGDNENSDSNKEEINSQVDSVDDIIKEEIEDVKEEIPSMIDADEADFTTEDNATGVTITGYTGTKTAIIIPATINGKAVTEIGARAFEKSALTAVEMPDSVTIVNDFAFFYSSAMLYVKCGKGLKTIGAEAFEGCYAMFRFDANEGLTSIGRNAFAMCQNLKNFAIPGTVNEISDGAFCFSAIEKISIPGSVKIINTATFSNCEQLKEVVFEDGVEVLGERLFESDKSLEKIYVPATVKEIDINAFLNCDATIVGDEGSEAQRIASEYQLDFKKK